MRYVIKVWLHINIVRNKAWLATFEINLVTMLHEIPL